MKCARRLLAILLLLPLAASRAADARRCAGKLNIVLFLIDDLGWKDVGCNGSTYYRTPHIDRLAREGVRFTDAYAACAVCSPTRAAILTGKYPARPLLTDWLPSGRWNPKAKLREGRFVRALPLEEVTLAEALREAGYRTASIGCILSTLKELGLEQTTLIVFTSDNGGSYNATSNAPLRGNKGAYYEGGIRVPLIVRWPRVTQAGGVCTEPVISADLYPTCLAAAGLPMRPNQHVDGVNLLPLLEGRCASLDRPALFWHYPHYNDHPFSVPSSVIRKGPWKLIETFDPEGVELYNLAEDLGETKNLAAEKSDLVRQLRRELDAWRRAVGAEMMQPNPDYDPTVPKTIKRKEKKNAKPATE